MKDIKTSAQASQMSADAQKRLLAYSTAAGLGAFFAGQNAEATVVQAPGLAPYPHVFLPPPLGVATNANDFYLSIEGGSITNFHLFITSDITSHPTNKTPAQLIRIPGFVPDTNNPAVVNGQALTALRKTPHPTKPGQGYTNSYCVAFLGGSVIGNNTNSPPPFYQPQIGISYNAGGVFPFNPNYVNSSFQDGFPRNFLGFRFTSSVDGQEHFGYMDVKATFVPVTFDAADPDGNPVSLTKKVLQSLVIYDCVYETTPEADITIPNLVKATSIINNIDVDGTMLINFAPNTMTNYDTSAFVVETSPTVGPSADWQPDTQATVFPLAAPRSTATYFYPASYQAVTFPSGATSQYWRIKLEGGF